MAGNPGRLTLDSPLDIDDARRAGQRMVVLRREAEDAYRGFIEQAGTAEGEYRKAFAMAFLNGDGSGQMREQWARQQTSHLAANRDITEGLVKAQVERLRGLEGERSLLKSLIDWSAKAEGMGA